MTWLLGRELSQVAEGSRTGPFPHSSFKQNRVLPTRPPTSMEHKARSACVDTSVWRLLVLCDAFKHHNA